MTQDKKEKILKLIAKLKSLASNNPNQEEAALAGARMQELVDRYKIAEAELIDFDSEPEPETDCHDFYTEDGKRFSRWKLNLAHSLAHANNCKSVQSSGRYVWNSETGSKVLKPASMVIIGTEENVAVCKYVFMYLSREIERLSASALRRYNMIHERKGGKSFSNAFKAGAVQTIQVRLSEMKAKTNQEAGTAMVLFDREKQAAEDWMKQNMRTTKVNNSMRSTSRSGYNAGKEAGKGLSIGRGNRSNAIGKGPKALPG